MTTAAKPLPPHGTYARANGSKGYRAPCKCEPCLKIRRTRKKIQSVNRQLGRSSRVDAATAAHRLRDLHRHMGWEDIASSLGTSSSHVRKIAGGRQTVILLATHNKIMRLVPQTATGGQYIDATGSVRRVHALIAQGHPLRKIAEAAGTHYSCIQTVVAGPARVRRFFAERIEEAYRTLSGTTGSSIRGRNRAARNGWAPPAAWDDDTIDNPSSKPNCGQTLTLRERAALRREEIIHFAWHGDTPEQILARLDGEVSISTVRQIVQEWRTGQKRNRAKEAA